MSKQTLHDSLADFSYFRLQIVVFALVSASFTNIYITQPVLPVLQSEFSADMVLVSLSVSAVILGIAISNLPFGFLADRFSIRPIICAGGILVAIGGLVCAITQELWILIGARFFQGIFIPALTTCLAAYLAKSLPAANLLDFALVVARRSARQPPNRKSCRNLSHPSPSRW